mmetsp:Transcript_15003/g.29242  ORF Transcript_15003/g.29242 Transcript_15003/m.29242 type:complete len:209 (+) Transcript_15003:1856-2482(+)
MRHWTSLWLLTGRRSRRSVSVQIVNFRSRRHWLPQNSLPVEERTITTSVNSRNLSVCARSSSTRTRVHNFSRMETLMLQSCVTFVLSNILKSFFDLGPDDEEEVKQIKLSLHLNLAQCCIKLEDWAETIKEANNALELDANSTKALFRLAFAQEKTKEFTSAKKNLTRAIKIAPEAEQKPLNALLNRVNVQIQREDAKRAMMAKRMFG